MNRLRLDRGRAREPSSAPRLTAERVWGHRLYVGTAPDSWKARLTYGLGMSLQDMTKPAAALGHVPVS